MRYAKLQTVSGPTYACVEMRGDELFATEPMPGPEEDPIAPQRFAPGALEQFELLCPVRPSKIVCVGRNYRDHAAELGNEVPAEPLLFLKPPSSLLAPGGVIVLPTLSRRVDFEGELAIVIGKRCRNLGPEADVRAYVRGYTLVNDVTARDIQKSDGQWTRGKGFDTFCPAGPIVSGEIDLVGGPVELTTEVNGSVRQQASTSDLIFPVAELLRYISACMTLEPGDLIPTGTPSGVGPMQAGEEISVRVPGLGRLRNMTAAE